MHGYGRLVWPNGRSYEGEFENDIKNGKGTYQWADGQVYTGEWHNGKQHGQGMHTALNGQTRVGIWQNGKRIKWLEQAKLTSISTSATLTKTMEQRDDRALKERNSEQSEQNNTSN